MPPSAEQRSSVPFIQVIEYRTSRWDDMHGLLTRYREDTGGGRTAERTTTTRGLILI